MYAFLGFLRRFPVSRFDKGSIILHQGEVPPCVYVVKKGIIKSYTISDAGDEKPVAFYLDQDITATTWAFKKTAATVYFYEAFTNCEVYCVPRDELQVFIHSTKEVLAQFLDRYITKYVGKTIHTNALEYSKAIDKIAHTLQYLCHNHGRQIEQDIIEIELPLSQQDLANLTGLTRETTGLELKNLQRRGIISFAKRHYVVHMIQLQNVFGEDDFKDVKLRA